MSHFTVLSGPERRRRWSDEEKAAILDQAFGSDGCVNEVARRHEVSSGLIYTWRRNARVAAAPDFVEVVVAGAGKVHCTGFSNATRRPRHQRRLALLRHG